MEARQRHLKDWLTKIRTRQILLPRFQRYPTWSPKVAADFLVLGGRVSVFRFPTLNSKP
jgi:hypothetical protein